MATVQWQISGDYMEACSCDSVCPCPTSGLAARPTKGSCDAGLVFHVERGQYGGTNLDGLSFAVLLHTPGAMIEGNWTVGVVVDERASTTQREALTAIASGQGGGPMAALGPLVGRFAGAEAKPIKLEGKGMKRSVSIPGVLDIAIEAIPGVKQDEPIYLDNVGHPAASRLALAKATRGPHARVRHQLGRYVRPQQRPLRAVFLAELGRHTAAEALRRGDQRSERGLKPTCWHRVHTVSSNQRCQ